MLLYISSYVFLTGLYIMNDLLALEGVCMHAGFKLEIDDVFTGLEKRGRKYTTTKRSW